MINQGMLPLGVQSDRFDDDRPLREEDCVIPEDQEQELEQQDDWGLPTPIERQPTDSELIEENGHVPMPESESQPQRRQSTQDSLASSPVVLSSADVSTDSVVDSQRFPFQQENIRETFVAGSDVESDSDGEDSGSQQVQQAALNTAASDQRSRPSTTPNASPAPSTPKSSQSSWMAVNLTEDSPKTNQRSAPTSASKATQRQGRGHKSEASNPPHENDDIAVDRPSSDPPQQAHQTPEAHAQSQRWGFFRKLVSNLGLGTPSADSQGDAQASDEESESAKDSQQATQLFEQKEDEEQIMENKYDEPEGFISSQATVILQYAVDNDEDANAFEYDGMLSDETESPRSVVLEHSVHAVSDTHGSSVASNVVDDDLTLAEEVADFTDIAATPQKEASSKEEFVDDDLTLTEEVADVSDSAITPQKKSPSMAEKLAFKTPSPFAQADTPGTEKKAGVRASRTSTPSTAAAHSNDPSHHSSSGIHPASPPSPKDPGLSTDASAKLSPAKSPSKLVISVGLAESRGKRSTAGSQGSKRSRQEIASEDPSPPTTNAEQRQETNQNVSSPQSHGLPHTTVQKRRRRDILSVQTSHEAGSQSPQFDQPATPFLSRRRLQSNSTTNAVDCYSLGAVCRALGSHAQDQVNQEVQMRSSRQPRPTWKRYENLFPPLNMTRLKQMIAEGKGK
ncbi:unnamed protein product [Phytophthora fragariaefolia]|uniref:Unnamed protein product n=1 Tax=Phytophthora fragariaefolia TaxID=1490495 RepID=A0A9W6U6U5_9STRA|nr:unnamed protein product [Phytophthora fragariaefolia]